jgi:tRNA(Ile)-lysidine synthase
MIIDRDYLIIFPLTIDQIDEKDIFQIDKDIKSPLCLRFSVSNDCKFDINNNIVRLDFDKLSFPLKLRKWKFGDKFIPLGMRKFKKISDFFIDEKYSIFEKKNQWILCSNNEVVWIVGKRIDDRYKIETQTKKVYIAELLRE